MQSSRRSAGWKPSLVLVAAASVVAVMATATLAQPPAPAKAPPTEVKDLDKQSETETYTHLCKYVKVRDVEDTLKVILGDTREMMKSSRPPSGTVESSPSPQGGQGKPQRNSPGALATSKLPHVLEITSDERNNTIFVRGPGDKIALAKAVVRKLDVPQDTVPLGCNPCQIITYRVAPGTAEPIAKKLQETFKDSQGSFVRIATIDNSSIMVYAGPEDHIRIASLLRGRGLWIFLSEFWQQLHQPRPRPDRLESQEPMK
jgi:hypothetical protein